MGDGGKAAFLFSPLIAAACIGGIGAVGLTPGTWIAALLTGATVGATAGFVIAGARGFTDGQLPYLLAVAAAGPLGVLLALGFVAVLGEASFRVTLLLGALTAPATWWWRARRAHAHGGPGRNPSTGAEALPTFERCRQCLPPRNCVKPGASVSRRSTAAAGPTRA